MNNKDGDVEMLNELIYENESNTIEMLNQSEIFFKLNEQIWSPISGDKQGWGLGIGVESTTLSHNLMQQNQELQK